MADQDLSRLVGKQNETDFWCPMCGSKVLLKERATMVEKEIFLNQSKKDQAGTNEKYFYVLTDHFEFENVGFSRNVDPTYKYLTCADCEIPIFGLQYLTGEEQGKIYVAHTRLASTNPRLTQK